MFFSLVLILIASIQFLSAQTSWVQKVSGGGLGNPFCVNPVNDNVIYCATGDNILRISRDRGNTWSNLSTISGGSAIKSVAVSASDTNTIIVAMEAGPPDKIMKTTNNGATWTTTLSKNFYYWGIPIAYAADLNDDIVYTMGSNIIYRSTNFGTTWDSVRANPFGTSSNQGWEYCIIRSDSPNVLIVGDNASGIWKSYNRGANWKQVHTAGGEVPALAYSDEDPKTIYATRWSGGGGFVKSMDGGETWNYIPQFTGINMWSVAVSTKNPNFLIAGTYGPSLSSNGGVYISRDAGTTWERTYLGLSATTNYGTLVLDTLSLFVLQGDGIFRYNQPAGSLSLTSPNGGELFHATSTASITWNAIAISTVKLEYSLDNGSSWNLINAGVPASNGSYSWVVPDTLSASCLIRVSNSANSSMNDQSNAVFSIDRVFVKLLTPNGGEKWVSGSTHSIEWNSSGVLNVKVQYTTDNGLNWNGMVSSMHASVGSYGWIVPQVSSGLCKIKISSISASDVFDISDSAFTISDSIRFLAALMLSDNGIDRDTLNFGEKLAATDGLDPLLGEVELTIKPPPGTFDARWDISGTNGTKLDLRDTLSNFHPSITYTVDIQPGSSGYPVTLRWNSTTFPPDYFTLLDAQTQGSLLSVDMLAADSCVIINSSITSVQIVHSLYVSVPFHANSRWNLVSLPMKPNDQHVTAIFPTATTSAYSYEGKYHKTDILEKGLGYWLKFSGDQNMVMTGKKRMSDTVTVSAGWNMIGSVTQPIATTSVTTIPAGIISSPYFGYDNTYATANVLTPGCGYWVKVSQNGKIILNAVSASSTKSK